MAMTGNRKRPLELSDPDRVHRDAMGAVVTALPVVDCPNCGVQLVDSQPTIRCPVCSFAGNRTT
jgi:uncharacterized Zn finger protein (UPF0148 family)